MTWLLASGGFAMVITGLAYAPLGGWWAVGVATCGVVLLWVGLLLERRRGTDV
jgi:hypothetical protein